MWGGMEPNEWIPEGTGGITDSSIEKVGRIIHLFIICGVILIGIQFNSVCVCVCIQSQCMLDALLNVLCLMGSEIHFS